MDNLMDLIFGIVYNDHDSDLIGRDQVDDYTIDTCLTADQWLSFSSLLNRRKSNDSSAWYVRLSR